MPLEYSDETPEPPTITLSKAGEQLQQARQRYENADNSSRKPAVISGAELLKQHEALLPATDQSPLFPVGSTVRHPHHGRGTVISITDGVGLAPVTVRFEFRNLEQTFVTSHCPLQPVG